MYLNLVGNWEVVNSPAMEAWIEGLDDDGFDALSAAVGLLEDYGPALRRPVVGKIEGSRHANMKELIPVSSSKVRNMRVLFAFDPQRRAILLIAGDKTKNWKKWYKENIPIADDLLDQHLEGDGSDD